MIRGFGRRAVISKETGELIGDRGLLYTEVAGNLEHVLAYTIHHLWRGNGYATEASEACKRYTLETPGIRRLVANVPVERTASARVARILPASIRQAVFSPDHQIFNIS